MKTFKQNHRLATALAVGIFGLASTGAFAMTSEHDTNRDAAGNAIRAVITLDNLGAFVVENPAFNNNARELAGNTIGGHVGDLPLPDAAK